MNPLGAWWIPPDAWSPLSQLLEGKWDGCDEIEHRLSIVDFTEETNFKPRIDPGRVLSAQSGEREIVTEG